MKRKIPILITAIAILIACAVPAFAAEIDYNDYITNENISGDNTIVDVSIPIDAFSQIQWRLWNRTNGTWPLLAEFFGKSFTYSYSQSVDYALTVAPFGSDFLDVRDMPDGTVLTFTYLVSGAAYAGDSGLPARIGMTYYDANGKSLGFVNGNFQSGQFLEDNAVSFTLDKPEGCVSVKPALTFDSFNPIGNQSYTFTLTSVSFQFSIDSLLRLQQETGRTNKILEEIQDKIDGITDYEPEPTVPGDGIGDALDDAEDELMDNVQGGMSELDDYTGGFLEWLLGSATAFIAIKSLLGTIMEVQMYHDLLYASLTLGSFALLLGAIPMVLKRRE